MGVGDVVVALLADVGVGAGASGEVTAAVAVSDAGLDHFGVERFDVIGDELAGESGNESVGGSGFRDGGVVSGSDRVRREVGVTQGHFGRDVFDIRVIHRPGVGGGETEGS